MFYDASRARWVGVLELERDPDTRKRDRRKVSGRTKTEARDKLAELRREYKLSGVAPSASYNVRSALADWLANPPATVRSPISIKVLQDHAARINAQLGDVRLVKLTPGQVEAALRRMADGGLSGSSLQATRSVLVRAIRRAQRDGLVVRNVADLADGPRGSVRRSKSMTLEQVQQLLAYPGLTTWWRAYIVLGVQCGLRPGEILGLLREDADTDQRLIRIRHALHRDRVAELTPGPLKTQASRRTLAMPADVRAALLGLRKEQAADRLRLGAHYSDSGLVFIDSAGRPCLPPTVTRSFKRLCRDAGTCDDWQPRELRHTFVSLLSHAGVPVVSIADAAGHTNANITRGVYRHQIADVVTQAASAMDAVFAPVGSP